MTQDGREVSELEQSAGPTPKELPDSSASLSNDYLNHYVEVLMLIEMPTLLRELYQKALQRAGYQVLTAATGEKALSILRESGERIDWLFTDIRLPGVVNGWVVGSEFSLNHPLRPVAYGSGYEPEATRQVANSIFLRKPVNLGELVAAFRGLSEAYQRVIGQ